MPEDEQEAFNIKLLIDQWRVGKIVVSSGCRESKRIMMSNFVFDCLHSLLRIRIRGSFRIRMDTSDLA